jgi:hypothetical protein
MHKGARADEAKNDGFINLFWEEREKLVLATVKLSESRIAILGTVRMFFMWKWFYFNNFYLQPIFGITSGLLMVLKI